MERGALIPWLTIAFAVALIIGALILLTGCASIDYDWQRTRPAAAKPWMTVEVADVDAACRAVNAQAAQDERILGCAVWRPSDCTIYVSRDAPAWIKSHEERHCDGFTHN